MALDTVILVPVGTLFSVSTITPLLAALDIRLYKAILISLQNPDAANPVSLLVDPGTVTNKFDTNRRQTAVAQPLEEAHIEIEDPVYPTIRVLAQTDSPFPVVNNVTFEVRARCPSTGVYERVIRTGVGTPG